MIFRAPYKTTSGGALLRAFDDVCLEIVNIVFLGVVEHRAYTLLND